MTVSLPDVPKGRELEEYVAAALQSSGAYVEKNIEAPDVLELDIVASRYPEGKPDVTLYEVKSGDWGFRDVFKLLGQKAYLEIPKAVFIGPPGGHDADFYNARCGSHGLTVHVLGDLSEPHTPEGHKVDPQLHELWRFSYWAERLLVDRLRALAKGCKETGPKAALEYHKLINNEIFLTPGNMAGVGRLYSFHHQHGGGLTLEVACEIGGAVPYDPLRFDAGRPIVGDAMLRGRHLVLQVCMYLEHRARLAILKGAVDQICREGGASATGTALWAGLPNSFIVALKRLADMPYFWLYPSLWQVFLFGWGGFLLTDHLDGEMSALATEVGMPPEHVETALQAFDLLFPLPSGSWIAEVRTASYKVVRLMPWPFMGLGAFRRRLMYGLESYAGLGGKRYTASDLSKRHNYTYKFLGGSDKAT